MSLPKSKHPLFPITVPSTGKTYNFRQFLGGEEKILLIAKQTGDPISILRAVEQIITNCAVDAEFNTNDLTTFDFDYVFIQLRAISVSNIVEINYIDPVTEERYPFIVNLNDITVTMPDVSRTIVNQDNITIVLRYPTMKQMLDVIDHARGLERTSTQFLDILLQYCVEKIYSPEEVFDTYSLEELTSFFEDQLTETTDKVRQFLTTIPDVSYTVTIDLKEGGQRNLVLKGIEDFFTWQ